MVVIVKPSELVPNGITNGYPTEPKTTRFPSTNYYFIKDGREIMVVIAPEQYDVSDTTLLGLEVLLNLRNAYVNFEVETTTHSFKYWCKEYIEKHNANPPNPESVIPEIDVKSIYKTLGVNPLEQEIYDIYRDIIDWWNSFGIFEFRLPYKDLLGVEQVIAFDVDLKIVGLVLLGIMSVYFGYEYSKSYAIEKGKVKARD